MRILNAYKDSSSFCQPSYFFTMRDMNYDNRLLREAVRYHFFKLSMGWDLEKKLNKLLIISTIILYIATTTESISILLINVCINLFYCIFNLN